MSLGIIGRLYIRMWIRMCGKDLKARVPKYGRRLQVDPVVCIHTMARLAHPCPRRGNRSFVRTNVDTDVARILKLVSKYGRALQVDPVIVHPHRMALARIHVTRREVTGRLYIRMWIRMCGGS
jgi:hypothetical protein